jgi:hypothetical protein
MQVDLASRSVHHRKYGTTFADSWVTHDGTTIVAVGSVFSGEDRVAVSDLVRTAAHALAGSRLMLHDAIPALDRIVVKHAQDHRDPALAVAVALLGFPRTSDVVDFVGAGRLHVALFDGLGTPVALYGLDAALGTGIEPHPNETRYVVQRLHRDDTVVASTVPVAPGWWQSERSAAAVLAHTGDPEMSAAVIVAGAPTPSAGRNRGTG